MFGIGLALIFVAGFHLVPAALSGEIPTTTSRRLRSGDTEYRVACIVFSIAAIVGAGLVVAALLKWLVA